MIFKTFLLALLFSSSTFAKINVVTTTTDLAWLASRIGGNQVNVTPLLNGTEDPHFLDAMPHMISKVSNADMFCQVGLELEIGWVPKILSKSGNSKVQQGGKGFCNASLSVKSLLDVQQVPVDRSMGDVHAFGNPHYHLSPQAFLEAGQTVMNTLINLDSKNAKKYLENYNTLKKKMSLLEKKMNKLLEPAKKFSFMEYHREFSYFFKTYGLKNVGTVESVPGVPPSAGRLAKASIMAKNQKVLLVLSNNNAPKRITEQFEKLSGIPVLRRLVSLRYKDNKLESYFAFQINLAKAILKQVKAQK